MELAIRTAMLKLGGRLLEGLLGLDSGHRGPRTGCPDARTGHALACPDGHDAQFISYRAKTIDTVVGR